MSASPSRCSPRVSSARRGDRQHAGDEQRRAEGRPRPRPTAAPTRPEQQTDGRGERHGHTGRVRSTSGRPDRDDGQRGQGQAAPRRTRSSRGARSPRRCHGRFRGRGGTCRRPRRRPVRVVAPLRRRCRPCGRRRSLAPCPWPHLGAVLARAVLARAVLAAVAVLGGAVLGRAAWATCPHGFLGGRLAGERLPGGRLPSDGLLAGDVAGRRLPGGTSPLGIAGRW